MTKQLKIFKKALKLPLDLKQKQHNINFKYTCVQFKTALDLKVMSVLDRHVN